MIRPFLVGAALLLAHAANGAPFITALEPYVGTTNGVIKIRGTGFAPGGSGTFTRVYFNSGSVFAPNYFVAADDQINVNVPIGAITAPIMVSNALTGTGTSIQQFIVIGLEPYVTNVTPLVGGTGAAVTITGVHFNFGNNPTSVTNVSFNGTPAFFTSTIADRLDAFVPPGATTGPISVSTPFGTNVTSFNFFLPPIITNFTPTNGIAGTVVTVSGQNFQGATVVQFFPGNTNVTPANVTATNLTAVVPAGARTGKLTVFGPGGSGQSASNFVMLPTMTSFSPPAGPIGANVTILGNNLFGVTSVTFNGQLVTAPLTTNLNGTNLVATVPAGATTGFIVVNTSFGSVTSTVPFYLPPSITVFAPSQGREGTNVQITGANFTGATNVLFNGVTAAFSNVSSTVIQAVVPGGTLTGKIAVRAPGGSVTNNTLFQVMPFVSGFSPQSGAPGDAITVFGTNFNATPQVFFTGSNAAVLPGSTLTQLTALVPNIVSNGPISVQTDGSIHASDSNFTVLSVNTNILLAILVTNSQATVSWTATNSSGFRLQSSTNLATNLFWADYIGATSTVGGLLQVTTNTTSSNRFFRLVR